MTSNDRMIKFIGIIILVFLLVGLFEMSNNKKDDVQNEVTNNVINEVVNEQQIIDELAQNVVE